MNNYKKETVIEIIENYTAIVIFLTIVEFCVILSLSFYTDDKDKVCFIISLIFGLCSVLCLYYALNRLIRSIMKKIIRELSYKY